MSEIDFVTTLVFRGYSMIENSTSDSLKFKNDNDYVVRKNLIDFVVIAFLTDDIEKIQAILSEEHGYIYSASAMTKEDGFVMIMTNNEFGIVMNNYTDSGSISIAPVKSAFIQNAIYNHRQASIPIYKKNVTVPNKGCLVFASLLVVAFISIYSFV